MKPARVARNWSEIPAKTQLRRPQTPMRTVNWPTHSARWWSRPPTRVRLPGELQVGAGRSPLKDQPAVQLPRRGCNRFALDPMVYTRTTREPRPKAALGPQNVKKWRLFPCPWPDANFWSTAEKPDGFGAERRPGELHRRHGCTMRRV